MEDNIYEKIMRVFPELKTYTLVNEGREVKFTRRGKSLIIPALVEENGTGVIYLDGTRYVLRSNVIMFARKADEEGILDEKSKIIFFSPEDIYFQSIAETKFITVWKEGKPLKEKAKPDRRRIINNFRIWLADAGLQIDLAPEESAEATPLETMYKQKPFIDRFGNKLVTVHMRMPGWRAGIQEKWATRRSWEEIEKAGNLCPAYYDERDKTGRHRMIREPGEKYCRAVLNIPYPEYLAIKRINVIAKNVINHYHIDNPEVPIAAAKYNDVEGVNLISRFIEETDPEYLKYAVWDGGIVLTRSTAKKIVYEKRVRIKIFEPPEALWEQIKKHRKYFLVKGIRLGEKVKKGQQILTNPKFPLVLHGFWKQWKKTYPEFEKLVFGEYYGKAPIEGILEETPDGWYQVYSGKRTVTVGDKLVSRTGIKGIITRIVKDGELKKIKGRSVEMLIGRTKLYSKAALVKELKDTEEISGYPHIFVFLRDKIADDDYRIYGRDTPLADRQILSDNFREACLSSPGLYMYAVSFWQRDEKWKELLNTYLNSAWLQIRDHKIRLKNGTGKKLREKELLVLLDHIPGKKRYDVSRLPEIPEGRIEFIKRPRLNKMIKKMGETGKLYQRYISEIRERLYRRNGIIREYVLNGRPPSMFHGILLPTKTRPDRVHLNPETMEILEIGRGSLVAMVRHPIIDQYSFGQFRAIPDTNIPRGCVGASPSIMPSYSADIDGDSMMIYPFMAKRGGEFHVSYTQVTKVLGLYEYKTEKTSRKLLDPLQESKEEWTLVGSTAEHPIGKDWEKGMKEWLLDGTWGIKAEKARSKYDDVISHLESYRKEYSEKDFFDAMNHAGEMQYWTVVGIGSMRKKVVATCQHLSPNIIKGILSIWDVEAGMDKFKLYDIHGSPKVVRTTLGIMFKYMQGKEKTKIPKLTLEDKENLKTNFEVLEEGPDWLELKVDIPRTLDLKKVFGIDDPLILWNVTPSAAGKYLLDITVREKKRLDNFWEMMNMEDFSPYGSLFHNLYHRDLFETYFKGKQAIETPKMKKTKREAMQEVIESVLPFIPAYPDEIE